MTAHTPLLFVQNNHVERLTVPVARFAHAHGVALEDRSSSSSFDVARCGIDWSLYSPVIPYGSVQFVRKLKASLLSRFIWHDEKAFDAQTWLDELGGRLLNAGGLSVCSQDVPRLLAQSSAHVRPAREDKAFNAAVFTLEAWQAMAAERQLSPELDCWVSRPKDIHQEWRCWLVDGELIEVSRYRKDGQMAVQRSGFDVVADLVRDVARTWTPAPCVVLDVAETAEGLFVLEFNPIHCAGWYAADVDKVMRAWLDWSCGYWGAQRR